MKSDRPVTQSIATSLLSCKGRWPRELSRTSPAQHNEKTDGLIQQNLSLTPTEL